jgi:hypothetical protein
MQGDDLGAFGILWGTAIAFALAAVTMVDSGRKRTLIFLWACAAGFMVLAIAWPWIAEKWPEAKAFGQHISGNQMAANAVGLIIFGLLVLDFVMRRKWLAKGGGAAPARMPDLTNLNRTAFLLSTAATDRVYHQRLVRQLAIAPLQAGNAADSDEKRLQAKARIDEYLSNLSADLYGSRWMPDLDLTLRDAASKGDREVRSMQRPPDSDPYIFQAFRIACVKRDEVVKLLRKAIDLAEQEEANMLQMMRERPDIHIKAR